LLAALAVVGLESGDVAAQDASTRLAQGRRAVERAFARIVPALAQSPHATTPLWANVFSEPKVVCGMAVVPANPSVDPKMVKPVPEGGFTMRIVPPPACAGDE
jgi:hypothetical protein